MRRESAEATAATRRRLALLGDELGRPPLEEADDEVPVRVVVVPAPGRHARGQRPPTLVRRAVKALASVWSDRLPESLRDRFRLSPAHLGLVALLVAGGLAVTAWTTLRAGPSTTPVPVAHTGAGPTKAPFALATPVVPPSASPSTEVVVDVAGKVLRPGVVTLPAGSRVIDALRQAGGARPGVDLSALNLARVLADGERILVGAPAAPVGAPAPGATSGAGAAPAAGSPVNLNTATLDTLDALPGVGPVTAQKILDWRTEHGSFTSVEELLEVDGIGEKTLAELAPHVTL